MKYQLKGIYQKRKHCLCLARQSEKRAHCVYVIYNIFNIIRERERERQIHIKYAELACLNKCSYKYELLIAQQTVVYTSYT